jgi:hypothetical protein
VAFTEMFGWEVVCMPGVQSLTERTREFAQLCGKLAEIVEKMSRLQYLYSTATYIFRINHT